MSGSSVSEQEFYSVVLQRNIIIIKVELKLIEVRKPVICEAREIPTTLFCSLTSEYEMARGTTIQSF